MRINFVVYKIIVVVNKLMISSALADICTFTNCYIYFRLETVEAYVAFLIHVDFFLNLTPFLRSIVSITAVVSGH
jgi:hypothetical protein